MAQTDIAWVRSLEQQDPGFTLDDIHRSLFWKTVLEGCLPNDGMSELFWVDAGNRFCFFGPPSTGKRTLARAFAGSVLKYNYHFLYAPGVSLQVGSEELMQRRIHELFREASASPTFLMLDNLSIGGQTFLWECVVRECDACSPENHLIVIIVEDDESIIQESWKKNIIFARFSLPTQEERFHFFKSIENLPTKNGKPSAGWLANATEGLNYTQLNEAVQLLRLILKATAVKKFEGDDDLAYEAALIGDFYYTQEMFEEIVTMLRGQSKSEKTTDAPPVQFVWGNMPSGMIPAQKDSQKGTDNSKLSEDEKAELDLLDDLNIPDDE